MARGSGRNFQEAKLLRSCIDVNISDGHKVWGNVCFRTVPLSFTLQWKAMCLSHEFLCQGAFEGDYPLISAEVHPFSWKTSTWEVQIFAEKRRNLRKTADWCFYSFRRREISLNKQDGEADLILTSRKRGRQKREVTLIFWLLLGNLCCFCGHFWLEFCHLLVTFRLSPFASPCCGKFMI